MYKQHLAAIKKQEDKINKTLNEIEDMDKQHLAANGGFTEKQTIQWADQGQASYIHYKISYKS